jgi:curved DNA-binding protein CbpA
MVESHYRDLVKLHHPDKGGDREAFERVMRAREAAIEQLIHS